MKICILSSRLPWPERGGDYIRTNRVAQYLKSKGHKVILVCFNEGKLDTSYIDNIYDKIYTMKRNNISTLFHSFTFAIRRRPIQCGFYYSYAFKKLFHQVVENEKPDLYICWLLRMSSYIEKEHLESKTILEMSDALSKTYSLSRNAKGNWIKRIIYNLERKPISIYENRTVGMYPKVVLVAQPDIDFLKSRNPLTSKSLSLHTIGIETISCLTTKYNPMKICFVGNMRTLQNQDAVLHFVNDIFPLILQKCPNAVFYIIGAEPSVQIQELGKKPNIVVTGFVKNIHDSISDSCLAVAPVYVAAGIQNKVLMAMGSGVPVVMTSLISKAIPQLKNGENCIIIDDEKAFANKCIELMENSEKRNHLATQGYKMVKMHYSWEKNLEGYEQFPQ